MEISDQLLVNALRFLITDTICNAKSGHPGMPLGFADVALCLYKNHITFNPHDPLWVNRDRLILSCGHGSALLYSIFHLLGYDYSIDDLKNFRKLDSKTHGHPEYNRRLAIEATTGPIGQGVAMAVGAAIAEAKLHSMFPDEIGYKTYVIAGDGDLMEGISHEAFSIAGTLKLNNLIVLYDSNNITIDGELGLTCKDDVRHRFESYGFFVQEIDGHDFHQINNAIEAAKNSDVPSIIICKTVIGRGAPRSGTSSVHGGIFSEKEISEMRAAHSWDYSPFEIPDGILSEWRSFYKRNLARYSVRTPKYDSFVSGKLDISACIKKAKRELSGKSMATRSAVSETLKHIIPYDEKIIGGSADLSKPTDAIVQGCTPIAAHDHSGNYIHYGIREHAMGAIANGISLDKVFRTYTSTFLAFSDYMRPAIREAAMMQIPQVFLFTHDSIGVGEDGPTHQPIEHLASLRAIPGLITIRPGSSEEVADAVEVGFTSSHPVAIILSRQACNHSFESQEENMVMCGGYRVFGKMDPKVVLVATGTEVPLAVSVANALSESSIDSSVISMPSVELFLEQSVEYQADLLSGELKVFIEAGSVMGLSRLSNTDDIVIGIDEFGKSASGQALFEHYGFSVDKILKKILGHLK